MRDPAEIRLLIERASCGINLAFAAVTLFNLLALSAVSYMFTLWMVKQPKPSKFAMQEFAAFCFLATFTAGSFIYLLSEIKRVEMRVQALSFQESPGKKK
jgi:hypothetical protein